MAQEVQAGVDCYSLSICSVFAPSAVAETAAKDNFTLISSFECLSLGIRQEFEFDVAAATVASELTQEPACQFKAKPMKMKTKGNTRLEPHVIVNVCLVCTLSCALLAEQFERNKPNKEQNS